MNGKIKHLYEFDSFSLSPDERTLTKDGVPLHLSPRAFDILVLLVENSGNLVEKQDLIEQVWNDRFVEEANIQVQISAIRKILNDKNNGNYIETVPKKGYRFNAEVRKFENGDLNPEQDLSSNGLEQTLFSKKEAAQLRTLKTNYRPILIIILLLFIASISLAFLFFKRFVPNSSETFQKVSIAKLTDNGKVSHAAISPDSTNFVYKLYENGLSSLWLRNLPSGAEKQLIAPSESGFDSLIFSPDGTQVYYTQTDKNRLTNLYRIPILSGDSQKLVDDIYGRVTFSPDGERLAFIRVDEKKVEFNLISAKTDGSDEKKIAVSKVGELFHHPAWSPDGKTIALFKKES